MNFYVCWCAPLSTDPGSIPEDFSDWVFLIGSLLQSACENLPTFLTTPSPEDPDTARFERSKFKN
jgi:hypothetical protein